MTDPIGHYIDWVDNQDNATLVVLNIVVLTALFCGGISLIVWLLS